VTQRSRLISKQDYDLQHKELEKIIPEKFRDLVLIFDDNHDVWHKYVQNLVQVVAYRYWDKEDDPDNVTILPLKDYYLHYLSAFIERAVGIFNRVKDRTKTPPQLHRIVRMLYKQMFMGIKVHFTGLVSVNENILEAREAKIVIARKGEVVPDLDHANLLLANTFKSTNPRPNLRHEEDKGREISFNPGSECQLVEVFDNLSLSPVSGLLQLSQYHRGEVGRLGGTGKRYAPVPF
jgi:hypothetical protein